MSPFPLFLIALYQRKFRSVFVRFQRRRRIWIRRWRIVEQSDLARNLPQVTSFPVQIAFGYRGGRMGEEFSHVLRTSFHHCPI